MTNDHNYVRSTFNTANTEQKGKKNTRTQSEGKNIRLFCELYNLERKQTAHPTQPVTCKARDSA
jgi:hypothetical protein